MDRTRFSGFLAAAKPVLLWTLRMADHAAKIYVGVKVTKLALGETTLNELVEALISAFASVQKALENMMMAL